jgi:hypothetical protein
MLRQGGPVSNRLMCDMKTVQLVRRIVCGRPAMLIPHENWASEIQFAADIQLPVLGCCTTLKLQSRGSVRALFREAGVITPLGTRDCRDLGDLIGEAIDLMDENRDLKRWIIRLGNRQSEQSTAWFDLPNDWTYESDLGLLFRKSLNCPHGSRVKFLSNVKNCGATVEAVPIQIRSFPTVSLLLTGNEIRVIGTFDRLDFVPFKFAGNVIPSVSFDNSELIRLGKQVGAAIMKRCVLGYVEVEFMTFLEEGEIRIMGFDLRLNRYPAVLTTTYMNLCCGFDADRGYMGVLDSLQQQGSRPFVRYAVVLDGMTHPAMPLVSSKELKKACYEYGLMFDLLTRIGYRMVLYNPPAQGKGFAISSGDSLWNALATMEKACSFLLKQLGQKVGSETDSSIAQHLIAIRHFKSHVTDIVK